MSRRTFGTEPGAVGSGVLAFADGLSRAGVAAAVKHFPGLGRVRANTDHTANVRDTTTDGDSPWIDPFRRAITAGRAGRDDLLGRLHPHRRDAARRVLPCR